jgi:hypothetical protein
LLDLHQDIERKHALGVNAQRIDFDFRYPRIAANDEWARNFLNHPGGRWTRPAKLGMAMSQKARGKRWI